MSRDAAMHDRLLRWADWLTVGDGSGYATVCVLHENWSPPTAGQRPTMKVARSQAEARATHRAIAALPVKLQATAWVHYVKKGSIADQALELQCQPDTVLDRVERLHRALLQGLCNIHQAG